MAHSVAWWADDILGSWSDDGRTIAFTSNRSGDWRNWASVPGGVYYAVRDAEPAVGFFDTHRDSSWTVRSWGRLPSSGASGFTVHPSGASLVFSQIDQTESDLMLMSVK